MYLVGRATRRVSRTPNPTRRFRAASYLSKTKPGTQQHVVSFGLRLGYWPCLKAPFLSLDLGRRRVDLWYGLPSYKER